MAPRFAGRPGVPATGGAVLRWMWQRMRHRPRTAPAQPIRGMAPDLAFIHANRTAPAYTWIGHSSGLLQIGGANLLLDPVFSRWASPVRFAGPRRHQPPGLQLDELPPIDGVLLSHNHYDHLDRRSVRAIAARFPEARFAVPRGTEQWFARNLPRTRGAQAVVTPFDWQQAHTWSVGESDVTLRFLPVQHWSNRTMLDRNTSLWGSWAIEHPTFRFWYSGDLGYSEEPRLIGDAHGPFDAAAIAIGAYEPRWFMRAQHVNPEEAVQVMLDVRAARAVAVHWGTFALTDEPLDQPPRDLATALAARGLPRDRFVVARHGETVRFSSAPDLPDPQASDGSPDTPTAVDSPSAA